MIVRPSVKRSVLSGFVEIPCSMEQGIILEEQGFFSTQRGIFRAEQGNSFWWGPARNFCVFLVDGLLKRHKVLRSDKRRRRLYLNE